jgi:Cu(I)/Ag(I) efflux system membrane protein CusA/SilA
LPPVAIAIGGLVDAALIVVERTHKKLEKWQAEGNLGGRLPSRR